MTPHFSDPDCTDFPSSGAVRRDVLGTSPGKSSVTASDGGPSGTTPGGGPGPPHRTGLLGTPEATLAGESPLSHPAGGLSLSPRCTGVRWHAWAGPVCCWTDVCDRPRLSPPLCSALPWKAFLTQSPGQAVMGSAAHADLTSALPAIFNSSSPSVASLYTWGRHLILLLHVTHWIQGEQPPPPWNSGTLPWASPPPPDHLSLASWERAPLISPYPVLPSQVRKLPEWSKKRFNHLPPFRSHGFPTNETPVQGSISYYPHHSFTESLVPGSPLPLLHLRTAPVPFSCLGCPPDPDSHSLGLLPPQLLPANFYAPSGYSRKTTSRKHPNYVPILELPGV